MTAINREKEALLSAERVRALLDYDAATGLFRWRQTLKRAKAGAIAGCKSGDRWVIGIDGYLFYAHRLAWLYEKGEWPSDLLDHESGKPNQNNIENLRPCSIAENMQNITAILPNVTGFRGVSKLSRNRWRASIKVNGKPHYLGSHSSPEKAYAAYLAAKARLHTFNPTVRPPDEPVRTGRSMQGGS